MIKWLFETLIGWPWCWHHWETMEERDRTWDVKGALAGKNVYLRCTKCGDWRKRRL